MSIKSSMLIAGAVLSLAFAANANAWTSHQQCTNELKNCFRVCNDNSSWCFNQCVLSYSRCTKHVSKLPASRI